jgi:hypothetical protein
VSEPEYITGPYGYPCRVYNVIDLSTKVSHETLSTRGKAVIKPTVGRFVWFWDSALTAEHPDGEPLAAIIARVFSDTCVNLCVFDSSGVPTSRLSVALYQDEGERPGGAHASWMPYQKGQAAKAEALADFLSTSGGLVELSDKPPGSYQGYEVLEVKPTDVLSAAEYTYSEGPTEIEDNITPPASEAAGDTHGA